MKESRLAFSESILSGDGLIIFDLSGLKYFVKGEYKILTCIDSLLGVMKQWMQDIWATVSCQNKYFDLNQRL